MEKNERRGTIASGLILLLLGLAFLAYQIVPDQINALFGGRVTWPLIIIGIGGVLLLTGLVTRLGGFIIPGCIVGGVGSMLYYQNTTGDWESWAYAWVLIPGFVGLGLLLSSLLDPAERSSRRTGLYMLGISAAVFAIFAGLFNNNVNMDLVWPVILIVVGLAFLVGVFTKK